MSLDHLTPFHDSRQKGDDAADRDQTLANLRGQIALAADCLQDLRILLGVTVALLFGFEDVMGDLVDVGAGALQNVGAAVDHGVEQFHQHHFAGDAGRAGPRQLVLDQRERFRFIVTHGHQAMAGEDEGDGRGTRHIGVGMAHQRRGHVARAALDIEPAGNLDLLHVLPGRDRDPGQPLHRMVLFRRRLHQVDPDRGFRQRRRVRDMDLLEGGFRGYVHREHGQLRNGAQIIPSGTQRDSDKCFMTGELTAGPHLWRQGGGSVALIRRRRHPCLETDPKPQNLRQKSHRQPPAVPNGYASTGIIAGFCR